MYSCDRLKITRHKETLLCSSKSSLLAVILLTLLRCMLPAQSAQVPTEPDHFDLNLIDKQIDPCVDFYQYSCKKWIDANPIPSDQSSWSHGSKLALWNQGVLRDTLEKASANDPKRSAVDQKIGDYYASCMDESAINAPGVKAIQPELDASAR